MSDYSYLNTNAHLEGLLSMRDADIATLRRALEQLSKAVAKDDDAWITSYEYGLAQRALAATEPST